MYTKTEWGYRSMIDPIADAKMHNADDLSFRTTMPFLSYADELAMKATTQPKDYTLESVRGTGLTSDLGIRPFAEMYGMSYPEIMKRPSEELIDFHPDSLNSNEIRELIEINENLREMKRSLRKPSIINHGIIANELNINNYTIMNFLDALEEVVESEDIQDEEKTEIIQKIKDLAKTLSSNSFATSAGAGLFVEAIKTLLGGH